VKRLAVALEPVGVALAAPIVREQLERALPGLDDLVGRVAGRADGSAGVAGLEQLAVDALVVRVLDADVALAAGVRHVVLVDRRARIVGVPDVVNPVAVVARGGDDQPVHEKTAAVHAVDVLLGGERLVDVLLGHQPGIGVALGAGEGKLELVGARLGVAAGEDVVGAVAVVTVSRLAVAGRDRCAVDAAAVLELLLRVAGGALG
jgi:hypothetical protein